MKTNLLLIIFLFIGVFLSAQESINPCGTISGRSDWLKKYQANPEFYQRDNDTILYVPLTIHLVGSNSGSGFFSRSSLIDAMCTLNADFEGSNIQFFIEGEINYLANSAYNNHETVVEGAFMMFDNNVENTINCYIVSDPAGNCGYNLPYAGIALRKSCTGPDDHTWAHEIGHALSIPHPFLGWEGGVSYDGSISHSFSNPAPTEVYYDYTLFKDTLYLDTLIIDTALVELVDGSNCHIAADGFCDTHPDYLAQRWPCNSDNESNQSQLDPDGLSFVSDATLIMSYAFDECATRFSDEQTSAMRANLYDEKPNLLYNQTPGALIAADPVVAIAPIAEDMVQFDAVTLEWEAAENAAFYVVQVSRFPTFISTVTEEYIVEDNELFLTDLLVDKPYYWKVRPYNDYSFCTPFNDYEVFNTADLVDVVDQNQETTIKLFPNLLTAGGSIQIEMSVPLAFEMTLQLNGVSGQPVGQGHFELKEGKNTLLYQLPEGIPAGVYLLTFTYGQEQRVEKIILR